MKLMIINNQLAQLYRAEQAAKLRNKRKRKSPN